MAFTFQINNDLQFIHDEALLSMAEVNHPQIKRQTVLPTAIVDLVEDETKLNGYGVKESENSVERILVTIRWEALKSISIRPVRRWMRRCIFV